MSAYRAVTDYLVGVSYYFAEKEAYEINNNLITLVSVYYIRASPVVRWLATGLRH